jgi:hypothetical protein
MLKESKNKITELIKDNQETIEAYETILEDLEILNVFDDDFPIKAKEIMNAPDEIIKNLLEYREKVMLNEEYLINIHSYEIPMFGDDYYQMEVAKMEEYISRIVDIRFISEEIGNYIGIERGYLARILEEATQKIKELEKLETLINESIEEFETIKYKLNQI